MFWTIFWACLLAMYIICYVIALGLNWQIAFKPTRSDGHLTEGLGRAEKTLAVLFVSLLGPWTVGSAFYDIEKKIEE
jgi:hypothetical protein